jgi:RNA polymerase sigma-70 factor (ECF subfamily)
MPVEPVPDHAVPPAASVPPELGSDERELVALILRRDRKATARFVAMYADGVYAYVWHRLAPRGDVVEDVVQEVFLAALSSLPQFSGTSLRAWLHGIARHKVEDFYRRSLREPMPLADDEESIVVADDRPLVDETIDRRRLVERTHQVLRRLPEAYSVALLWRYWEGRSAREMATAAGKTEKAIERLLARARERFRQLWDEVQP